MTDDNLSQFFKGVAANAPEDIRSLFLLAHCDCIIALTNPERNVLMEPEKIDVDEYFDIASAEMCAFVTTVLKHLVFKKKEAEKRKEQGVAREPSVKGRPLGRGIIQDWEVYQKLHEGECLRRIDWEDGEGERETLPPPFDWYQMVVDEINRRKKRPEQGMEVTEEEGVENEDPTNSSEGTRYQDVICRYQAKLQAKKETKKANRKKRKRMRGVSPLPLANRLSNIDESEVGERTDV